MATGEVVGTKYDPCEEEDAGGDLEDTSTPEGDGEIPDVDFPLMKPPHASPFKNNFSEKSTHPSDSISTSDQAIVTKFYQFMFLMMMRHVFGKLWPGSELLLDPTTQSCDKEEFLKKRRMKLRQMHFFYGEDKKGEDPSSWEVVPQLSSEEGA